MCAGFALLKPEITFFLCSVFVDLVCVQDSYGVQFTGRYVGSEYLTDLASLFSERRASRSKTFITFCVSPMSSVPT